MTTALVTIPIALILLTIGGFIADILERIMW